MAATIKGVAVRWGVSGVTMTAAAVDLSAKSKQQSADFDRASDKAELKDANGEVVGQVFYNAKKTLRMTVVPYADTITNAETNVDSHLPAPGTKMTIVDSDGTVIDDVYNLISAKARLSNSDFAMIDMEMEAYDANEVATDALT